MAWGSNPKAQQPELTPHQKLAKWEALNNQLTAIKKEEAAARKEAFAAFFPNPKEGTNTADLPNGFKVKGQHKISRSFSVPEGFAGPHPEKPATILDAVQQLGTELARASNEGAFIAERLIKYSALLADGEYKKLPENLLKIVNRYVTSKTGSSTIEIVPPKAD